MWSRNSIKALIIKCNRYHGLGLNYHRRASDMWLSGKRYIRTQSKSKINKSVLNWVGGLNKPIGWRQRISLKIAFIYHLWQSRAAVARQAHILKVVGSNPTSAI